MAKIDDSVKKKVPELRFKGFTDDWEERKLSDIADRFDNLRVPITASDRKSGDTPYYGANGIQDYVEGFTHDGEFILVAEDGANDLKNYPVQYVNGKVWVNNHAHVLQGKNTITDNKFLMNSIKNFNIEPFLVGGGRAKLNADVMMKLNILLPTFDEQEKIGSFFSLLDDTIALHQRKLDLLKEQKKGFLQKMFPKNGAKVPELRFAGFADDWEQRKLSEGTSKIGDGLHGTPNYSDNGDVFFINGNNLVNGKIVITKETKLVTESNQSKDDKLLNTDTILMSINGTIGNLAWYNNERVMLGKSAAYLTVSNFDKKFIFSYLQTSTIKNYFLNNLTGTTIKNLGLKTIRDTTLFVPTLEEQQQIGEFFWTLEETIALHQRKLDLLKEQKKGFLQKMFV
ncbi:restriction endonuclease subunit S [Lactococcus lactis]|nr:restriction endonuclease subunit S [Lactococcus lactis]